MAKHSDTVYTIEGHRSSHQISYHTARKDLDDLAKRGLLRVSTRGRKLLYRKGDAAEAEGWMTAECLELIASGQI